MLWALVAALCSQSPESEPAPARPQVTDLGSASSATAHTDVVVEKPAELPPLACARWKAPGLLEGPVAVGYGSADLTLGRRACPRTELGVGATFGAIIDTPNFYGNVGVQAVLYGAYALNPKTELFAHVDVYDYEYTVNAVITGSSGTLGNATLGLSRQVYQTETWAGAFSARVLLPTASNIPGTRTLGGELGHSVSLRATTFLEVHGWLGVGLISGLGPTSLPGLHLVGMVGAALSPFSWFSLVVDVSGGLAGRSFFAPSLALRFRVFNLGIELAATRPLLGTDRHDAIGALRLAWRF